MTIAQEGVSKSMALFTDKVKEIFLGISTIKTFNAEKTMEKSLKKMNNKSSTIPYKKLDCIMLTSFVNNEV